MDSNNEDFAFCQVGVPVNQDDPETMDLVSAIDGITLKDEFSNANVSKQSNGILWRDKLPNTGTSAEQEMVDSLSFNVIDASSPKESSGSRQMVRGDTRMSVKSSDKPKIAAHKRAPRAKVPFEKGYSPMDWLKLTRTHPDLAGLKGQSNKRLIPLSEIKQHQTEGSMWTVLKGRVYNISPYMKFHPGGVDMLMKAVGKDCTSLFNKYHAWVNAEFLLEKCLVGTLDDSL